MKIRLTENQLHRVIKESVRKVLREGEDELQYTYLDYLNMEVGIAPEDVEAIAQSGDNENAARELLSEDYFTSQFDGVDDERLIDAATRLSDEAEIEDREDALMYIGWIAAWNIADGDTI